MQPLVRTPFNYTGNKYKLLPQLLPLLPPEGSVDRFIDCFWGGGTVGANVPYKNVLGIEVIGPLVEIHQLLIETSFEELDHRIVSLVAQHGLTCSAFDASKGDKNLLNKPAFLNLRNAYNENRSPEALLVLLMYCFNNNLRFNPKGHFNVPVGKRDYNKSVRASLQQFMCNLKAREIHLLEADFGVAEAYATKDSFVYADPPYLITQAQYNASWTVAEDQRLMELLDRLSASGVRFCMSNVLSANGMRNTQLEDWSRKYTVIPMDISYGNSSYNKKNKEASEEVCILNY